MHLKEKVQSEYTPAEQDGDDNTTLYTEGPVIYSITKPEDIKI